MAGCDRDVASPGKATKPGKGMKEMLALPLDEGFCIPVDFKRRFQSMKLCV